MEGVQSEINKTLFSRIKKIETSVEKLEEHAVTNNLSHKDMVTELKEHFSAELDRSLAKVNQPIIDDLTSFKKFQMKFNENIEERLHEQEDQKQKDALEELARNTQERRDRNKHVRNSIIAVVLSILVTGLINRYLQI